MKPEASNHNTARQWTWARHIWLTLAMLALGLALALAASLTALRLGPLGGMEYHAVCAYTFGPHEDADVIFIGDSSLLNGVMPEVVEQGLKLRTVSLPLFAHSGGRSYQLALERYLGQHPAPRCVVLYLTANAPSHWLQQKYERIFTLARYGSILNLVQGGIGANDLFRTAWTFFLGWFQDNGHFRRVRDNLRVGRGWQPPSLTKPLEEGAQINTAAPIVPAALEVVGELRQMLRARGIRFTFLLAPMPEGDTAFQEQARRYQGLSDSPPITLPNRLFVDYTHMLPEAALQNSRHVADILAREMQP